MKPGFVLVSLLAIVSSVRADSIGLPNEKWGEPVFGTPGGLVTWSIIPGGPGIGGFPYIPLDSFLPPGYESELQWAFAQWSAVANIQFQEVSDNGASVATSPDAGVIRFAGIELPIGAGILAQTAGPIGTFYESQFGFCSTTRFTSNVLWSYSDGGPGYNFDRVALHEIGHLLGLGHEQDVPSIMNVYYSESLPLGLQADDIAGAQFIYGATVPEPSTFPVLLGVALCGLAASGWMQRRRSDSGSPKAAVSRLPGFQHRH